MGDGWGSRRAYRCQCGRPVFFQNSICLACGTPLGYEPHRASVVSLSPGPEPGSWRLFGDTSEDGPVYQNCGNLDTPAGCNWLVKREAVIGGSWHGARPLCVACRLNRTIPNLADARNRELWRKTEAAKRRMVSQLLGLGLQVRSRIGEDPQRGLAFDFLRPEPGGPRIVTGHRDGLITLDVEEADDVKREAIRAEMREPYRTLLGHLRHEVGHYYWDRLVAQSSWLGPFRQLFGDERQDYEGSLQRHYAQGPAADWSLHHVSAYASAHPWEDWAETWAHYLHIVDTLETALGFGIDPIEVQLDYEAFKADALYRPDDPDARRFLALVNGWSELAGVLNELSRSMGLQDFYPFVLSREVVGKLQFVHLVVRAAALGEIA
ncbi:MAG: putative zinc-binding metallopeptidase [Burkholderiaceae bacterium]